MKKKYLQAGVTLIELTIVMVVFAILAVPFSTSLLKSSDTLNVNDEVSHSIAHANVCADYALKVRRNPAEGFASVVTGMCAGLPAYGTLVRNLTVETVAASALPACISGNCKNATITVSSGGVTRAEISILFMN